MELLESSLVKDESNGLDNVITKQVTSIQASMPSLAAGPGASRIQDRRADLQSSQWHRAPVSGTTQPRC